MGGLKTPWRSLKELQDLVLAPPHSRLEVFVESLVFINPELGPNWKQGFPPWTTGKISVSVYTRPGSGVLGRKVRYTCLLETYTAGINYRPQRCAEKSVALSGGQVLW